MHVCKCTWQACFSASSLSLSLCITMAFHLECRKRETTWCQHDQTAGSQTFEAFCFEKLCTKRQRLWARREGADLHRHGSWDWIPYRLQRAAPALRRRQWPTGTTFHAAAELNVLRFSLIQASASNFNCLKSQPVDQRCPQGSNLWPMIPVMSVMFASWMFNKILGPRPSTWHRSQ